MSEVYDKLMRCYNSVKNRISITPEVALVLGSGLGDYADGIRVVDTLDYHEIEGFPVSTVPGHAGRFVFGYVGSVPVVCMQGRVHYYEGYSMQDVVLPIRLMKLLGAKVLFLTNAAGGIKQGMSAGDFMMITGQIGCMVPSPLIGESIDELGERFPDMSRIYDEKLQQVIRRAAVELNTLLWDGTYMQLSGPNFETPQEIAMCRTLGADAVGMSTACEAIAANHMGMRVCGISCISNMAAGISPFTLTHREVQEMADRVAPRFKKLLTESIERMHDIL
ncbi:MAG: purine-nucleoside phosphorylase [Lachnospiraceae bacterium]|nr:purine-nucleoside phosphorylase [Lachnospiraceae bacterium]